MQQGLFKGEYTTTNTSRVHYSTPTYTKPNSIYKLIKELNTIPHIYRYKTLYKICSLIYLDTCDRKLDCLDYYTEEEKDGNLTHNVMYAMIKNSASKSIKERILLHIALLKRIYSHDSTLEYSTDNVVNVDEETSQMKLF